MQNRTWIKVWNEVETLLDATATPSPTKLQKQFIELIVDKYAPKTERKVKKNGKKRAYTRKTKAAAGSQETPVVAKKRGRKPKALSTVNAVGEPETVGASSANDPGWGV